MSENREQNQENVNALQEQDVNRLEQVRRDKLKELQEAGKDPFRIVKYDQEQHSSDVLAHFDEYAAKTDEEGNVLKHIAASEKDIEQCHLQAVMDLFAKQVGRQVDLPYEMKAKRVYEGVRIQKKEEAVSEEFEHSISLQTGNHGTIFYDDMKLEYRIIENSKENQNWTQKSGKQWFACDIIQNRLTVRTRRPGDYTRRFPATRQGNPAAGRQRRGHR